MVLSTSRHLRGCVVSCRYPSPASSCLQTDTMYTARPITPAARRFQVSQNWTCAFVSVVDWESQSIVEQTQISHYTTLSPVTVKSMRVVQADWGGYAS